MAVLGGVVIYDNYYIYSYIYIYIYIILFLVEKLMYDKFALPENIQAMQILGRLVFNIII